MLRSVFRVTILCLFLSFVHTPSYRAVNRGRQGDTEYPDPGSLGIQRCCQTQRGLVLALVVTCFLLIMVFLDQIRKFSIDMEIVICKWLSLISKKWSPPSNRCVKGCLPRGAGNFSTILLWENFQTLPDLVKKGPEL